MKDRVPVNPGRVLITPENGSAAYYATMTRADNPTQEGTPLNKSSLLKDATAALFGLGTDAVPDDVLAAIKTALTQHDTEIAAGAKIATGSYTGTNTYGSSNPCSLTFGFKPKLVIISGYMGRGTGSASSANASAVLCPDISGRQNYAAFDNSNRLYNDSMGGQITVSVSGNTISWYSTNNATEQMNYNTRVYYYVAIG